MGRNKSSISKAQSYKEIGEFWDSHDLTEHWEQTEPVGFEVKGMSRNPNTEPPQPGQQPDLPPRAEAIRRLVRIGLDAEQQRPSPAPQAPASAEAGS